MKLGENDMDIASRSLERKLQDKGIDVRDGEPTVEMQLDPNTPNLRIIINGPKHVTDEIEMLWNGKTMNMDLTRKGREKEVI